MEEHPERLSASALAPIAVALAIAAVGLAFLVSTPTLQTEKALSVEASPTPTTPSTPKPKPLTKAEFVKNADAICGKIDKIEMDDESTGLEDSARDVAKFRKQLVKGIDQLLALVPPREDSAFLKKNFFIPLKDDKKIVTVYFKRLEKAFRAGDLVELRQVANAAAGTGAGGFDQQVEPLQNYGFRVCVPPPQEPYVPAPYVAPPPVYVPPAGSYDSYTPQPYPTDNYVYEPEPYPTPEPTPTPLIDLGF